MQLIANQMSCCLVLHNMCVSDRIMDGDVCAWYNPANSLDTDLDIQVEQMVEQTKIRPGE